MDSGQDSVPGAALAGRGAVGGAEQRGEHRPCRVTLELRSNSQHLPRATGACRPVRPACDAAIAPRPVVPPGAAFLSISDLIWSFPKWASL